MWKSSYKVERDLGPTFVPTYQGQNTNMPYDSRILPDDWQLFVNLFKCEKFYTIHSTINLGNNTPLISEWELLLVLSPFFRLLGPFRCAMLPWWLRILPWPLHGPNWRLEPPGEVQEQFETFPRGNTWSESWHDTVAPWLTHTQSLSFVKYMTYQI